MRPGAGPGAVAFRAFSFAPAASPTLQWASFRFLSPQGPIRVRWDRAGDGLVEGEVTVPDGATCSVALEVPDGDRALSLVTDGLPAPAGQGTPPGPGWPLGAGTHRVRWQA